VSGVLIVGASGHGKVVAGVARSAGRTVLGFLDRDSETTSWAGRPVLGTDDDIGRVVDARGPVSVVVAIGDNATRREVVERVRAERAARAARAGNGPPGIEFATLVHADATVAPDVEIGPGSVVMAGAVLNPGVRVGRHCIVNTGALVDHDGVLGDYASVGPGACLGGDVRVGEGAVVSLGASVIHRRTVAEHAVLGAGALAVDDVPPGVVAYGVPARVVRERAPDDPYL